MTTKDTEQLFSQVNSSFNYFLKGIETNVYQKANELENIEAFKRFVNDIYTLFRQNQRTFNKSVEELENFIIENIFNKKIKDFTTYSKDIREYKQTKNLVIYHRLKTIESILRAIYINMIAPREILDINGVAIVTNSPDIPYVDFEELKRKKNSKEILAITESLAGKKIQKISQFEKMLENLISIYTEKYEDHNINYIRSLALSIEKMLEKKGYEIVPRGPLHLLYKNNQVTSNRMVFTNESGAQLTIDLYLYQPLYSKLNNTSREFDILCNKLKNKQHAIIVKKIQKALEEHNLEISYALLNNLKDLKIEEPMTKKAIRTLETIIDLHHNEIVKNVSDHVKETLSKLEVFKEEKIDAFSEAYSFELNKKDILIARKSNLLLVASSDIGRTKKEDIISMFKRIIRKKIFQDIEKKPELSSCRSVPGENICSASYVLDFDNIPEGWKYDPFSRQHISLDSSENEEITRILFFYPDPTKENYIVDHIKYPNYTPSGGVYKALHLYAKKDNILFEIHIRTVLQEFFYTFLHPEYKSTVEKKIVRELEQRFPKRVKQKEVKKYLDLIYKKLSDCMLNEIKELIKNYSFISEEKKAEQYKEIQELVRLYPIEFRKSLPMEIKKNLQDILQESK